MKTVTYQVEYCRSGHKVWTLHPENVSPALKGAQHIQRRIERLCRMAGSTRIIKRTVTEIIVRGSEQSFD